MHAKGLTTIIFLLVLTVCGFSQAPERCGTTRYETLQQQLNPNRERSQQFENWMLQKLITRRFQNQRTTSATYTIPVVVHIIHNGEPIGTGTNISDNQVLSQIS
ncbi:MAG: hypothetical protein KIT62_16600, partial [Cyclobacteriaceae bacterium]|nr:hypothetical protein [Cyclobacteriaceae bacterium]